MNRLTRIISLLISALIVGGVPASLAGQSVPLSSAVIRTTIQAVIASGEHQKQTGALQPADLKASATALQILFAYMQEQGVNAKIDSAIRGNSNTLLNAPTGALAQKIYDEFSADGISSVTLGQIGGALSKPQQNRVKLLADIRAKGVADVESEMVEELLMLSRVTAPPGSVASNALSGRGARLVQASFFALTADQCTQLGNLRDETAALAVIVAVTGAEPVAAAFTAASLGYAIEFEAGGC